MSLDPYDHNQPEVVSIDAFGKRTALFEDGKEGRVTNWIDAHGVSHHEPVSNTLAVVVAYPEDVDAPWYACLLGEDERHPDFSHS